MANVTIVRDSGLSYPATGPYSPPERYPEYRYPDVSGDGNRVYAAVRQCFLQAGLDAGRFGTPNWNPLGQWIKPAQRVFVLCNFVHHRRPNESNEAFVSKCTHASVLRALVDYVLIAVGPQGQIQFGNAPVQSCRWRDVLRETGAADVARYYQSVGAPVEARDLRLMVTERSRLGAMAEIERRDEGDGIPIDLSRASLLADVGQSDSSPFRLSDYDSRRTEAFHSGSSHVYVVNRHVLGADVIVSIPKLKTHEKVGITCALKGCVGAIGHKDCLAHHRFGPPDQGGDEYPSDRFGIMRVASRFHEWVYRRPAHKLPGNVLRVVDRICRSGLRRVVPTMTGAWWGNDTAWRMALDVARIIRFADRCGTMRNEPLRPHLALIDGIVGGEGEGPLKPTPVGSGMLLFGDDVPMVDYACAQMMGFDPARIPLVREAFKLHENRLTDASFGRGQCTFNGREMPICELPSIVERRFDPPPGWRNFVELTNGMCDKALH